MTNDTSRSTAPPTFRYTWSSDPLPPLSPEMARSRVVLGWISVTSLVLSIIIPVALPFRGLDSNHKFWVAWETGSIIATVTLTAIFWLVEVWLDTTRPRQRLAFALSTSTLLGGASVSYAAWTATHDGSVKLEALLLTLGAALWSANSYWMAMHYRRELASSPPPDANAAAIKKHQQLRAFAEDTVRRYTAVHHTADIPATLVFLTLFAFSLAIPLLPQNAASPSEREHELRAFLSGSVAFQFIAANAAYVLEFRPWQLPTAWGRLCESLFETLNSQPTLFADDTPSDEP